LPIKVLDRNGSGTYANVASGLTWAADQGAQVLNMSLGGSSYSATLESAVNYAPGKGAVIVAAAGNNRSYILYPAAFANVVAVGVGATRSPAMLGNRPDRPRLIRGGRLPMRGEAGESPYWIVATTGASYVPAGVAVAP
jgi:hypothetical protein